MIVTIKQGDTYPPLRAYLRMANGKPIRLAGATVRLIVKDSSNIIAIDSLADVKDEDNGQVEYQWQPRDTANIGKFRGEFEVTTQNGSIVSVPNDGYFTLNIVNELG